MTNNPGITFTDNGTRAVVPTTSVNISLRHLDTPVRETRTFGVFPQPAWAPNNSNRMFIYDRGRNAGYIGNYAEGSVITGLNGGGLWKIADIAAGSAAGGVGITLTPFNYPNTTFTFGTQTQVRTLGDRTVWTLPSSLGVTFRGKADLTGTPRIIWGPGHQAFRVDSISGGGRGGANFTVTPIERPNRGPGVGRGEHRRGDGVGRPNGGRRNNGGTVTPGTGPVVTKAPIPTAKPATFAAVPYRPVTPPVDVKVGVKFTFTFGAGQPLTYKGMEFSGQGSRAMMVPDNTGGIDFNADKLNLQLQNAGKEIKFKSNPAMLAQLRNAPGFTSVVIGMQPMTELNFKQFLGA